MKSREYDSLIVEAALRYAVDPKLLKAIVWKESGFDARRNSHGAYGLMQVGKGTGIEWAAATGVETFMPTDLLDARTNLHVGAWYFRQAINRWKDRDDPSVFALAEYVAGPGAMQGWCASDGSAQELRQAIQGSPTGEFVDAVLEQARRY